MRDPEKEYENAQDVMMEMKARDEDTTDEDMTTEEAAEVLRNTAWLGTHDERERIEKAVQMAANALTAQPEIIRCKDCKHWLDIDDGRQKHRMCADVYGDWFCADAERREDA